MVHDFDYVHGPRSSYESHAISFPANMSFVTWNDYQGTGQKTLFSSLCMHLTLIELV
jgi:hypothetical protein